MGPIVKAVIEVSRRNLPSHHYVNFIRPVKLRSAVHHSRDTVEKEDFMLMNSIEWAKEHRKNGTVLYLYLLSQEDNTGYETYDSCVVAARNESEARLIHPYSESCFHIAGSELSPPPSEWCRWASWANSPETVKVKLIGTASPGMRAGVIITSYNGE